MRLIGLLLKFLIFLPVMLLMAAGVIFSVAVAVVLFVLTGRRRPQFKVYTSRDFQGAFSGNQDPFARPPMRDVTPRSATQLTNE